MSWAVVVLLTLLASAIWDLTRPVPYPALLQDLPGIPADGRAAFRQRLTARFLSGTDEGDLIRELWRQRFKPAAGWRENHRQMDFDSHADLPPHFDICRYTATVNWDVDSAGHVLNLTGDYGSACL